MPKIVNFYNVGLYCNDELTNISLLSFIDEINSIQKNRNDVVRKVGDKIAAVFGFIKERETDVRVIPIGKFRTDFKPYVGELSKPDFGQIDKDVIELSTLYYNDSYKVAAVTYNGNGLKRKDIENYFNTFLPQSSNIEWKVKLEPIIVNKGIEKIENSRQVKKIAINLDLDDSNGSFIRENTEIGEGSFFKSLSTKVQEDFSANKLTLEFGVGTKKTATMEIDAVLHLLNLLNIDTDYIESLNVTYKDNETQKVDTLNLKNKCAELKDKILKSNRDKNPSQEKIRLELKEIVNKNLANITRAYRGFWQNTVEIDLPNLVLEPKEENRVNFQYYINNIENIEIAEQIS